MAIYAREQYEGRLRDPVNGHVLFWVPGTFGSLNYGSFITVSWSHGSEQNRTAIIAIN